MATLPGRSATLPQYPKADTNIGCHGAVQRENGGRQVEMAARPLTVRSILRHRSICWLISLLVPALIVVLLSHGAMSWPPVAFAIMGPGAILGLGVVMVIGVLGLSSRLGDMSGLEGPTIYMLISVLMGIVFWWALMLIVLLRRRRKLLSGGVAVP
ncbi:MAG: hypothetical protein PGN25_20735 [Methylorubrum populi]